MNPVDNTSQTIQPFPFQNNVKSENKTSNSPADTAQISNTSKVFEKLDNFLNLGKPDRLDLNGMNDEEKKEFLKMLADLIHRGIVGYEILEVNGKPEKHYIVNEIGDKRIYGAKLYRDRNIYNR